MIGKIIRKFTKKQQVVLLPTTEDLKTEAFISAFTHLEDIPVTIKKIERKGTIINIICDQPQLLIGLQGSIVRKLSNGLSKYLNTGIGVNIEKFES